jgi:hypothetical protein
MDLITAFESLCQKFLQQEPSVLVSIDQFVGDVFVEADSLCFTLPAVYQYVCEFTSESDPPEYSLFRKSLYASDFNTSLALSGGVVVTHHSTGQVDSSIYKLVKVD